MASTTDITLLERYHLEEVLGRGGMGIVYKGTDDLLRRRVAVKLLSGIGLGTDGKARMLREARSAAGLNHPNIVGVYDAGEADLGRAAGSTPFVVMELVAGQNLAEEPPRDLDQVVDIARQLCGALDHAHSHQIIHRDLKPENVLITQDGTAKLVDFGLARSDTSRLTVEGTIAGTLAYLPPELALGQDFDGRADLYSLGVMLYELTTGQLPFTADNPVAMITQHLHAPVVPPRAHNPEMPATLDDLIVRLMAKKPEERPASAAEVLAALDNLDSIDETSAPTKELTLLDRIVRGRFVGRENELAEVKAIWNRASAGQGQMLLISGEPGIGKSRLTREIITQVEVTGGSAFVGECYAAGGAPYDPFAQIVRQALQAGNSDGTEHYSRKEIVLPDFVLADLLILAPELRLYYQDIPPNPALDPELEQRRLFENMVTFSKVLSEGDPLLIVLEDAHWADSGTLAMMQHLIRRTRGLPVLITATFREIELDEGLPFNQILIDLNRERLATRIKLTRFNQEQTEKMLSALFAEETTPGFLEGIYRETEGNPFFIEEVCKSLVEDGQIYYEDGSWQRPSMAEMSIPQSVRVAIQSRVSKLPDEHQELLRLAAVLGREFDYDTVEAASELHEDQLISALESTERSQLIEEVSKKRGGTFSFAHALIPATLVESLSGLRQRRMHQNVAEVIERLRPDDVAILAYHYDEAGNEEKALKYHTLAGFQASKTYSNQEAERHFRAGLELDPDSAQEADLLAGMGVIAARLSRFNEATETWQRSAQLYAQAGNDRRVAWCYARMARAAWDSGEPPRGLELAQAGLELVGNTPDSPELADLLQETARAYFFAGIVDKGIPVVERALSMARAEKSPLIEADSLITRGILIANDPHQLDTAQQSYEEAIDLAQTHKFLFQEARARNNLSIIIGHFMGNSQSAREHLRRASQASHEVGDIDMELFTGAHGALYGILMGELDEVDAALSRLQSLVEENADLGTGAKELDKATLLLEFARGSVRQALDGFRAVYAEVKEAGDLQSIWDLDNYLAEGLMELNELEEPEVYIREAIEISDTGLGLPGRPRTFMSVLHSRRGEIDLARRMLEEAQEEDPTGTFAYQRTYIMSAETHLALAERRWDDAWTLFARLIAELERFGLRHTRAKTLQTWARVHLSRGDTQDIVRAGELLLEAREEFEAMGAPGYVEDIQLQLDQLDEVEK